MVSFSKSTLEKIFQRQVLKNLTDSKKLSEKKRESLYTEIYSCADLVVHQFIGNKFIDKFGISYSIFDAIRKLVKKSKHCNLYLLIDGNYDFKAHQTNTGFYFPYRSIVKGDSKVASISAASIIAKVKRDRFMDAVAEKFPEYEFKRHKGYGTALHIAKIREHGMSVIHRKSFQLKEGAHGV